MAQIQLTHTISQNCHCEICCGMHLTRQNTSITPDRNESVRGPEKISRSYHRHSHCSCQIETVGNILYPNDRHAGSRLSWLPWQKTRNWKCRYVYTPMLSGLRWPGQTVMGSWPPANCNEEDIKVKPRSLGNQIKQVRSSTFLQMVHTHTHTHGQENTTKDCPLLEKTWENQASIQLSVSQEHPESNSEFGVKGALHPLPVVQAARKHSWVVVANKGDWKRLEKHGKGYLLLFQWWFTYFVFVRGPLSLSLSLSLSIALSIM